MNQQSKKLPKLTIGLPIYNGESFIRKRLENILSESFTDFELIISDDSMDATPSICQEFANKDKRIHYIHQKNRMGLVWNFDYLLKQAKSEYFVWAGVDDKWTPDFLEKNIAILDSNKDVVGSMGKIERYGPPINEYKLDPNDSSTQKIYKKFRRFFRPFGVFPVMSESYEDRVRTYLKIRDDHGVWAVYRTKKLQKCMEYDPWNFCLPIVLNVLKYGKLHVFDKVMIYYYTQGTTSEGILQHWHKGKNKIRDVIFPWSAFTLWCSKNLGVKVFLKNLDHFILLQVLGFLSQMMEFVSWFKNLGSK